MNRSGRILLLLTGVALLLQACGPRPGDANVLTIAIDSGPASLDPRLGSDEASKRVNELIYNGLFRVNEEALPEVDLAESYERPDALTVIVTLRQGVSFHDGSSLTSRDVAYTYRSILQDEVPSFRKGDLTVLDEIATPDERTILFRLNRPFAPILTNLNIPILRDGAGPDAARHPIGTGPFRLVRYRKDEDLVLTRFDRHFAGRSGASAIRLKIIPTETGRLLALLKGSVDLIVNDLTPDQFERVRRTPGYVVESRPGRNYVYMAFNMEDPILSDRRVRVAIALALDRVDIVRHLLLGGATLSTGFLPPDHWAYAEDVTRHDPDHGAALRLLDEAGLRDPDGPGPAARFHLVYKTPAGELARQQAAIIQQQLAAVGIDVEIRAYEWPTFYEDLKAGRFQIVVSNWTEIGDPDILRLRFHSRFVPPHGFNRGRYRDLEVDRLLERGAETLEVEARRRAYAAVQRILARDLPYVSLWHKHVNVAYRERVHGFRLTPGGDFFPLREVRLEEPEVPVDGQRTGPDQARRRPRTSSTARIGTAPERTTRGGSLVRSRTVDARPPRVDPPSRMSFTDAPRAASTSTAVEGAACPDRLALVATIGPPAARARAAATGCGEMRTPTVRPPPSRRGSSLSEATSTRVRAPGQNLWASRWALSGNSLTQRATAASSAAINGRAMRSGLPLASKTRSTASGLSGSAARP
jgi:peptide/nickel transport system substrate-binding protein